MFTMLRLLKACGGRVRTFINVLWVSRGFINVLWASGGKFINVLRASREVHKCS